MSGYTTENNEPKKDTTPPPASDKKAEEAGDNFDDFGYPVEPKKDEPKQESKKEEEPEKGVDQPATGYAAEPAEPKEEVKEPAKEVDSKKETKPKSDDEFKIEDKGDLFDEEVQELEKFIKDHKLSKEVAKALVEQKKAEVKRLNEEAEKQQKNLEIQKQKKQKEWYNELKNDPEFGGEKFDFNVKRAERVVQDFMPNIKKVLTETKVMLPPYIMRDLALLAKQLYGKQSMVDGEPTAPKDDKEKEVDPLAFYNS